MPREAKLGLLLVVGLTSVFGFMVYKRLHQPSGLVAGTAVSSEESTPSQAEESQTPPFVAEGKSPAEVSLIPAQAVEEDMSLFKPSPRRTALASGQSTAITTAPARNATLASPAGEDDPFASELVEQRAESSRPIKSVEVDDPFMLDTTTTTSPPTTSNDSKDLTEKESRHNAGSSPLTSARGPKNPLVEEIDPFDSPETSAPSTRTTPSPPLTSHGQVTIRPNSPATSPVEDDPFSSPPEQSGGTLEAPFPGEATATSTTVIEAPPTSWPSTTTSAPLGVHLPHTDSEGHQERLLAGTVYVVQPQDNFWVISKKVYGSGRYFQALMKHNESIVPDATRMRPGTQIATPNAEELLALYPELIDTAPSGSSPTMPQPIPGSIYVVEVGDNYWVISKKVYGTPRYFQALAEHNKHLVPDPVKLRPGTHLQTPPAEELVTRYPTLVMTDGPQENQTSGILPTSGEITVGFFLDEQSQPHYRVGANDTLTGIAKAHLGRSSRWMQILEMNRDVLKDDKSLKVGTVLKLPADASSIQVIATPASSR